MASSDRRVSFSSGERQRTSRSYRTPPDIIVHEGHAQQEDIFSETSRQNTQEMNPRERSESLISHQSRSTTITSNVSRKKKSSSNLSAPSTKNQRIGSKTKKNSISINELESEPLFELNDSEKQDLSACGLRTVPTETFDPVTLRRLTLSYNNLSDLPPTIGSLINLEYLDMSHNPLIVRNGHNDYSCFPREFSCLTNLQTLILAECKLKHIPVVVWQIVSLQTLDLSRNQVGYIFTGIGNLTELRHLRLSQMNLDTLPVEIGFCNKIETIDLRGNPIDNLPESLVACRQLYDLKLNYERFNKLLDEYTLQLMDEGKIYFEHIPQVIFELENLRILDLNKTKINFIPNDHKLFNLTELYLSDNSLFDIPESLCTMEQLKILDMSDNRICIIPEYFIDMKRLEILNLSKNELTSLSQIFGHLLKLKKLIVSQNQLHTIEKEFSQSQSLLKLDLSYNNLTNLPYEFGQLEQLELLDLRYNKLEYLPLSIHRMIGLKSMNTLDEASQRTGLHLVGNFITDPPSDIWKSTDIHELFNHIETKEKSLFSHFHHLKLILIGPKNIGKTTLARKLVHNRTIVSNTRKTIDMYVSILQEKHQQLQTSVLTDQRIGNRISTRDDYPHKSRLKTRRIYPPPLKTYRSTETSNYLVHKSTFITKNNFYCTIFDVSSEPNFEILYPLIYDSKALYILPVNLTSLLNSSQITTNLENINKRKNTDQSITIDFDVLLTNDWLYCHIYRYLESISDHCEQVFIAIIGLVDGSRIASNNHQELLNEIHFKVNAFLLNEGGHRENINLYSDFFPTPIHLNDEQMLTLVIEQLDTIAQQWNILHHKQKQQFIKQRLGFYQQQQDALIINYDSCLKHFQQQKQFPLILSDENEIEEDKLLVEEEINQMSFDECLDYLKLIGDILIFGQKPDIIILIKPYYTLNKILANTLFRPHIDQWLDYNNNMVFRFSGYYSSQKLFDIDRQRLLTRGEFTWKMLNVLFFEQNNNDISLNNQNILDYCRLMERLYLGYLNESNLNYHEFTTACFVCPWLMSEKCFNMDYIDYFKSLEQERHYDNFRCGLSRHAEEQQLWTLMDEEQEDIQNENLLNTKEKNSSIISDLVSIDSEIVNQDSIQTIKILNTNSNFLPNGLYERLLICLHPLLNERLDYYNLTLGRTIDKNLIKIQRFDEHKQIHLTIDNNLLGHIQNLLVHNLFLLYPNVNLRIETLL